MLFLDCGVFCHGTNLFRGVFFSLFQMFNFNLSGLVGGKTSCIQRTFDL